MRLLNMVALLLTVSVKPTHHYNSSDISNGNGNGSGEATEFSKRGYGEPCACDSDCDFGKWLICQNGYCHCAKNSFIFDYTRHTCVVKLQEKCFEIAQEYIEYNPKDLPPTVRCVEGAFCSMSAGGVCACNTYGYYQALDGTTCQRKKHYGQPCTRGLECKSDVCSGPDGKCVCNIGEFYHKRRKRCVSLVGAICFGDDDCLDNGICMENVAVCGCAPGYLETHSRTCEMRLKHGDPCSDMRPCNSPELACTDSMCQCRYSNHQFFDNATGRCISFPSGPCTEDGSCAQNSKCVQNVQSGAQFQECQCQDGFLEMPGGACERFSRGGEACQASTDCDPISPLFCIEGYCNCRDGLTKYDVATRSCRGLVGARCSKSDEYSCVPNAVCRQPNSQLPGRCQCRSNFSVARDRTCVPS